MKFYIWANSQRRMLGYMVDGGSVYVIPRTGERFRSIAFRTPAEVAKAAANGLLVEVAQLVHQSMA